MTVVGQAKDSIEAIELFCQMQLNMTLMDLWTSQMGEVEAITVICAEFNTARTIMLTTHDRYEDIYWGLWADSKGCLLKDCKPHELQTAIHAVYSDQQYTPPYVDPKLVQQTNNPGLTDRELEVLQLVAQGMSNLEISAALKISESTVKSNINCILSKLEVKDRTQATIITWSEESQLVVLLYELKFELNLNWR